MKSKQPQSAVACPSAAADVLSEPPRTALVAGECAVVVVVETTPSQQASAHITAVLIMLLLVVLGGHGGQRVQIMARTMGHPTITVDPALTPLLGAAWHGNGAASTF